MRRAGSGGRFAALLCAAFALAASAPAGFADPPAFITLSKPQVFGTLSRPAVRFTHGDHGNLQGVTCLTCHHVYKDGKNIQDIAALAAGNATLLCASCHATPRALEMSFHQQCITCHDAEKAQGRVTGPRACGDCHAWNR
jgi:hypothetical protein